MNKEEQLMQLLQSFLGERDNALFDKAYGIITQAEYVEQLGSLNHHIFNTRQELRAVGWLRWVDDLIRTELTA